MREFRDARRMWIVWGIGANSSFKISHENENSKKSQDLVLPDVTVKKIIYYNKEFELKIQRRLIL